MRWHIVVLFVVTALAAVAFVPGIGADGEAGVTYRVQSASVDTVRVTATFHAPNTTLLVGLPAGARDVDADGLTRVDNDHDFRLEGPATGSLTYTVSVRDQEADRDIQNSAATSWWALFRRHRVEPDVVATDTDWSISERYADDWQGVAGADVAYWGPHERYDRRVNGQTISLVVPSAAVVPHDEVLDVLVDTAETFRVGARDDRVTVFVAPDPVRRGGLTSGWEVDGEQELWVHESSTLDSPNDVWVHEYVHTRQNYVASDRVAWFREGSAEYYGALIAHRQGRTSFGAFQTYLRTVGTTGNATLDAPDTWASSDVPYEKGALVAAALDARIRQASDGDRSLQWVVSQMNGQEDTVTDEEFREFAERAAGRSLDDWFDRYVNGTAVPTLPQERTLYLLGTANETTDDVAANVPPGRENESAPGATRPDDRQSFWSPAAMAHAWSTPRSATPAWRSVGSVSAA